MTKLITTISALGLALGLTACVIGANDDVDDAESPDSSFNVGTRFCPAGFSFDATHQMCTSATEALGPFPASMIDFCKRFVANRADGTSSCETTPTGAVTTRWARQLAFDARTSTLVGACPRGTQVDVSTGYCADATNLYGPFTTDDVNYCKSKQGGLACETNRIGKSFARPRTGFSAAAEIKVANRGAQIGKLVIAIGFAEGTLHTDGSPTPAYFGHNDSGIPNIGLWSCTVCGNRSAADADQFYYDSQIAPRVNSYLQAAGSLANHPMVAAMFFGLLVQSPEAALNNADADDLAAITILSRGQLTAPVTEAKLLDVLVRSWTVNGVMQWRSPDTGLIDPVAGRADQLRRLRAYESALKANGVTPYP